MGPADREALSALKDTCDKHPNNVASDAARRAMIKIREDPGGTGNKATATQNPPAVKEAVRPVTPQPTGAAASEQAPSSNKELRWGSARCKRSADRRLHRLLSVPPLCGEAGRPGHACGPAGVLFLLQERRGAGPPRPHLARRRRVATRRPRAPRLGSGGRDCSNGLSVPSQSPLDPSRNSGRQYTEIRRPRRILRIVCITECSLRGKC
jgi:hypothetical protein